MRRALVSLLIIAASSVHGAPPLDVDMPLDGFTVNERMAQYRGPVIRRLDPYFHAAGVEYPPGVAVLVGLKQERRLELYAGPSREELRFIRFYRVLAASGGPGPKLREGDRQVPEGLYSLAILNPNSDYHLSLKVSYPNAFDRMMGRVEGRRNLGGSIFIHGGSDSAGCLAMSDSVAEELFILAADTGVERVSVIISPVDLRYAPAPTPVADDVPVWAPHLYSIIERALRDLPPAYTRWANNDHLFE